MLLAGDNRVARVRVRQDRHLSDTTTERRGAVSDAAIRTSRRARSHAPGANQNPQSTGRRRT